MNSKKEQAAVVLFFLSVLVHPAPASDPFSIDPGSSHSGFGRRSGLVRFGFSRMAGRPGGSRSGSGLHPFPVPCSGRLWCGQYCIRCVLSGLSRFTFRRGPDM